MGIIFNYPSRAKGSAEPNHVLEGETFESAKSAKIQEGNMQNRGSMIITPSSINQNIPEGYHNGSGTVQGSGQLLPSNIRRGISLFNVEGTLDPFVAPTGNATPDQVLAGRTFENVNGAQTGTMPNQGAWSRTITTQGGSVTLPQGYYSGSGSVTATFANLVADNVREGVNIGGVLGTLVEGKKWASGEQATTTGGFLEIQGLDFEPSLAVAYQSIVTTANFRRAFIVASKLNDIADNLSSTAEMVFSIENNSNQRNRTGSVTWGINSVTLIPSSSSLLGEGITMKWYAFE